MDIVDNTPELCFKNNSRAAHSCSILMFIKIVRLKSSTIQTNTVRRDSYWEGVSVNKAREKSQALNSGSQLVIRIIPRLCSTRTILRRCSKGQPPRPRDEVDGGRPYHYDALGMHLWRKVFEHLSDSLVQVCLILLGFVRDRVTCNAAPDHLLG